MSTHWNLLPMKTKIAGACMFYKNIANTLKYNRLEKFYLNRMGRFSDQLPLL